MTSVDGSVPRNMTMTASEGIAQEGLVFKITTNAMTIAVAKGDAAVAVADQAMMDDTQTAVTATSGEKEGFFLLGSGAVVRIASITGITYAIGDKVYLDDSQDGMINKTAATSTPVGHYVGDGETTTANGDLVDVILDVMIDAATE